MKNDNVQSREFAIVDFDEVMSDTKVLNNMEIIKNFKSIKEMGLFKFNKEQDVLNEPINKDADTYNLYILSVRNNVKDIPRTFLGEAIAWKIKSPYTHSFISLDINMDSSLGMLTQGLCREFPEFYGYQSFKWKFKRDYDVHAYPISKEEYKKGRKLFSNMIINIQKYSYDFLGIAKPLLYKLDSSKLPIGNNKHEADIESYHKKTSFICSTFVLYMITSISKKANSWYHEQVSKANLITSCFNPASVINIPGMKFLFNVPPTKSLDEVRAKFLKTHSVNN